MPTLSVDGAELYYDVRGQGAPLLLVAGLAFDSTPHRSDERRVEKECRLLCLAYR